MMMEILSEVSPIRDRQSKLFKIGENNKEQNKRTGERALSLEEAISKLAEEESQNADRSPDHAEEKESPTIEKKEQRIKYIRKDMEEDIERTFPRLPGQKFKDYIESFLLYALKKLQNDLHPESSVQS
jgi:hypothetical protein